MRLLAITIGSIAYLFLVLWVNIYSALNFSFYILILSIIVAFVITYILYRQYNRKLSLLKRIGFVNFFNSEIKINIGNHSHVLPYKEIEKIRLEKFLYPIKLNETRSKYSYYILLINHRDKEEKLIVGDISKKFRKISITKTLEHLSKRKLIQLETKL